MSDDRGVLVSNASSIWPAVSEELGSTFDGAKPRSEG